MFYVYILYSSRFDSYYVGQTNDLKKRFIRHNNGYVKSTKRYTPWELKFFKEFKTRKEAMDLEKHLKAKKSTLYLKELIDASR